jgi:hypothetical protein
MAVIQKTLFPKNLDNYSVLVNDLDANSKYFKITELPDTITGGKNAFLIAGSNYLVADTKIQIELKDSAGNIIYHEPGEGYFSSSFNGTPFVTEYYEGVSKVVAVYVYPDTAYGPCTLTILGELNEYEDDNGIVKPIPMDWENKYNVKWQKTINVNPSLANTTKIRFYQRPQATITEILNPIYTIVSGSKIASAVTQSFADIKLSKLETFAGDVKRIKVFRTSEGDISDYNLIQDILVESKELLTSYGLSGSVIGQTGILTSETLKNYWNTGSLNAFLTSSRVESGVRLTGSGYFTYTSSLDIKSTNTYELNLDAFYSASISSNLGIYLVSGSASSSIATLNGTTPTKNLLDTIIPFKIDKDFPSASLYFSQSQGEWHLGNISLKLSQDTAFSPDEISFVTTMPTDINNQTYNFKFEFYDVNNNYVPVAVTQSAVFKGGNAGATARLLTFQTDRSAFRFSTGSFGNPANQTVKFSTQKTNLTGSVTYASSAFDIGGNYITPASYAGTYPGTLTNVSDNGALLTIANFSGSVANTIIGSIVYTASCENFIEFETIYRFEDGDNAPGVFVTSNTNQFIYKATDLSLNPSGQTITIEAKRKNLASTTGSLTVNSGSGPALTLVSTNPTNGVDTYTLSGTSYPYSTGETIYSISGSDQFGNQFSDAIKISPVKILDGLSATLTNDNASLPALSNGFVASGSFILTSGSITVKVGNENISFDDDNDTIRANNTFAITNVTGTGCTPNTGNNTNPSTNEYGITNLTQDSGSLNITISYKDGAGDTTSIVKTATYTKNKKASPVLTFVIGNNNQSTDAKSTGEQISAFNDSTLSVKEQYNGASSNLTLLSVPTINSSSAFVSITKTTTNLSYPNMVNGTDSVELSITGSVTDSEGTNRQVFGNVSLTKVKKAAPLTLTILSSETQTILSSSVGFAAPATFTTNVTEGGSNYTYDSGLSSVNTYYISSITGGTNSSGTITPTTPSTTTGTNVSLTISYKNSEGSTGTIIKTHKVGVSLEGTKGTDGTPGSPGSPGSDGRRTATGMIFYQPAAASSPATPSAASYTFSTNSFGSLTANWGIGAPTYAAGNSNKYWYSTYTAVETTAGGGTAVPTFSTPAQAINFTGLVTFTSANNISDGSNTSNIVEPGSVANHIGGANVTTIEGGKISTGVITSTGYTLLGADTLISGSYMGAGTIFNLDNGSLRSKNFYISSAGDAFFKGNLTGASGTFSGTVNVGGTDLTAANTLNANTTATNVGLGSVQNLNAQSQAQTGLIAGTTITGGGITLNGGGNIKGGQTDYNTGTGFFLGYHGSAYKFSIGNASTKGITWDGNALSIGGDVTIGATLASTVVSNASTALSNAATAQTTATNAGTAAATAQTTATNAGTAAATAQTTADAKVAPSQVLSHIGGTNITTITGGKVTTGQIKSGNHGGTADGSTYSSTGTSIDLDTGGISAKNFHITTAGAAFFRGSVTADSGEIGGWTINASSISKTASGKTITLNSANREISLTGLGTTNVKIGTEGIYTLGAGAANTTYIGDGGVMVGGRWSAGDQPDNYITLLVTELSPGVNVARQIIYNNVGNPAYEALGIYSVPTSTNASFKIFQGGANIINGASSNSGYALQLGGTFYCSAAGTFAGDVTANVSDERLKTNIRNIDSPLEKISKINGVYFNWNDKAKELTNKDTKTNEVGFIAQEIEKVFPEVIKAAPFDIEFDEENSLPGQNKYKSKSGENYLTIQYEKMVPLLVECIKELKAEIDELKKNKQ